MPGFAWGPFTAELRFGLEGMFKTIVSPDDADDEREESYRSVWFLYPSNLVESFVIHIEL
ncbi:MAG: hypothetical protein JW913_03765 [Chitinispirillaceae bacterium]|nr:hypothetical protein [Chitinispirillaceae bacterium]